MLVHEETDFYEDVACSGRMTRIYNVRHLRNHAIQAKLLKMLPLVVHRDMSEASIAKRVHCLR